MSTAGLSKARLGRLHDVMGQDKFDAIEVRPIDMFDQPERTN